MVKALYKKSILTEVVESNDEVAEVKFIDEKSLIYEYGMKGRQLFGSQQLVSIRELG